MNISQTKAFIKQIRPLHDIVPALVGPKGIGKTEMLKQIAFEEGIGYQAVYPSSLQGEDFMGLLQKDVKTKTTVYLAPDFMPTENAVARGLFPEEGIFVLEEFNRGDTQTISSLFPLLQERNINGHKLAPGWSMAVCMNPDNMSYTTNSIDNAGLDRILPIDISPDLDEYASYMIRSEQANDDILNFLFANKEMFNIDRVNNDMDKSPSPRGWTKISRILNYCSLSEVQSMTALTGLVGSAAAASFCGFIKDKDMVYPDAEAILKKYTKEQQKIVKDVIEKNRYDVLNLTFKRLILYYDFMSETHIKNMKAFINDMDKELKVLLAKQMTTERLSERNEILSSLPEFKKEVLQKVIDITFNASAA